MLYIPYKTKSISVAYASKFNNKRKKQKILLMITNGKKQHYLAVTDISALFQKISSNHDGDFYCLNFFGSYTTKNKLKEHEEICNNNESCSIDMPSWAEKTLKYNPGEKSLKAPFTICLDLECLLKKNNLVKTILKNLIQKKKLDMNLLVGQCFIRHSFDEKKINYYRGKDCIKKLCKKIKEKSNEIINHEKKK